MQPVRAKDDFLVFGSPLIEKEDIDEVVACLESSWIGTGPRVAEFESRFAEYKNVKAAVAVNSCTAALHLSLLAAGVGAGDEVITTSLTFCATVNSIIHSGAMPVLADVDPETMNIDFRQIREKITPKTKAILIVHFAGYPCDMGEIMSLAAEYDLKVIEDCAHAIESEYGGRKIGTFGDFSCFSFYSTKNLVTGEGGMILAKNDADVAKLKILALHGMSKDAWKRFGDGGFKHYQVVSCGFKYNMMDLQAALGINQLKRVDGNWKRRKEIWNRYIDELSGLPITLPKSVDEVDRHAYHLFPILIDEKRTGFHRDEMLDKLTFHGIGVGVHYLSLPEHPYYSDTFSWRPEDYPNAMKIGRETISLPISPKITFKDQSDVIKAIKMILQD